MSRIVNSGALSIVNVDDFKQLTLYIGSSESKTVIYDPNENKYTPNYSEKSQILSPQLYIAGSNNNVISNASSINWYMQKNSTGEPEEIGPQTHDGHKVINGELEIHLVNVADYNSVTYICDIKYLDPESNIEIPIKSDIQITKVFNGVKGEDGESSIFMNILTPNGNTIKNSEGTLELESVSYKGAEKIEPSFINWYKMRGSFDSNDIESGDGWQNISSGKTDSITINSNDINSMNSFMCITSYIYDNNLFNSGVYSGNNTELITTLSNENEFLDNVVISANSDFYNNNYKADILVYYGYAISGVSELFEDVSLSDYVFIDSNENDNISSISIKIKDVNLTKDELIDYEFKIEGGDTPTEFGKYIMKRDIVTVMDLTDPYTVIISGQSTFKNGQGQSSFLARVYQNGEEIDLSGSKFKYSWSLYKEDGTAIIDFGQKLGKSITVNSSDFIERANLICEISSN